jgi:predicted nucleic acid-binding protein
MDLICGEPKISSWATAVAVTTIGISVVSFGQVRAEILATDPRDGQDALDAAFRKVFSIAKRVQRIEPFDTGASKVWATLLNHTLDYMVDGRIVPLGDPSKMVVATALDRNLILVERSQPYHRAIANLRILDPY